MRIDDLFTYSCGKWPHGHLLPAEGQGRAKVSGLLVLQQPLLAAVRGCCSFTGLVNTEIALNEFHDFCYTSVQVCE